MRRCHDCGVEAGRLHKLGCDWEICSQCGMQRLCCDCDRIDDGEIDSITLTGKRIPYGTVREIAARIPYYDTETIEEIKIELLEAIREGRW